VNTNNIASYKTPKSRFHPKEGAYKPPILTTNRVVPSKAGNGKALFFLKDAN
jgi:hypothetical protein